MEGDNNNTNLCDLDSSDLTHQDAFNSLFTMEIGIAKLEHSYLDNHMLRAKVVQNPKSPKSRPDKNVLCDLSTDEGTLNPSGYSNHEYEEIGNVSKEGNSSESFERSRSFSSEDVFASGESDDYLEPISSPKSIHTDDSGPSSPPTVERNCSPTIMNEYEALSPVNQDVCTSYTTLTLKMPNQSTVNDSTEAKETDIYESCDTYENEVYVPMMINTGRNDQSVNEKEAETSFEYQRNDFLLVDVKDSSKEKDVLEQQPSGMNIYTNEADMDFITDEVDVKDSCSVRSVQGSVAYLDDDDVCDVSCDVGNEMEETENNFDTTDSDIKGELDLSPLGPVNQVEDEIYRNEYRMERGDNLNAYQEENEDDLKDNCSVTSAQGSDSYLEDSVSNVTADITSVCKSDYESEEDIGESHRMKSMGKKHESEQYSKDDHHFSSSTTSDLALDQIPSNLVKRLSQQFSKSMGDLRYVPFPFTARKTSLPKHNKVMYV